jgi:hypothetical protein
MNTRFCRTIGCPALALALSAALMAGCSGVVHELADGSWHLPIGVDASALLLAGDDVAPDELVEFFDHEGEEITPLEKPAFPAPLPARRKRPTLRSGPRSFMDVGEPTRFGVRAGYLSIGSAEYVWPAAPSLGIFLNMPFGRTALQLGAEYAGLEAETGETSTSLTFLSSDFLIALSGKVMIVAGARAIVETPEVGPSNDVIVGGAAGAGVGMRFGNADIRAMYHQILSSGANTESFLGITAGLAF